MGDKIIITEDEPKPDVVIIAPQETPKVEKVVTEKVTIVETKES